MTTLSDFSDGERALVLGAPRAVMEAAVVADGRPSAIEFAKELSAGAKAFREARRDESTFVRSVAAALREGEGPDSSDPGLPESAEAEARALKRTEEVLALLRERADEDTATAFGRWLVRIAMSIAEAAKSKRGGFFSRKVVVSEAEQAFIAKLKAAVEN